MRAYRDTRTVPVRLRDAHRMDTRYTIYAVDLSRLIFGSFAEIVDDWLYRSDE